MFTRDVSWEHLNLNWAEPIAPGTVLLNNTGNGETGTLKIDVDGWYYVRIAGGGGSSELGKNQNAGSGSTGAGFIGEIFLVNGVWSWQVGARGPANRMASGQPSSLLKNPQKTMGIIAGPGWCNGHYPNPAATGGVLEQKRIMTRNVILASNGNPGYPGYYGGYQTKEAESVLAPHTGEPWGRGGSGQIDSAKQGILYVEFRGY